MPMKDRALHDLWRSVEPGRETFDPARLAHLPAGARRFLAHGIAPGALLPNAVRLTMTGTIRLKGWCPFEAEQVIVRGRGMIWAAKVKVGGLPIRGYDRLVDGEGAMRWSLFGLIPFLRASGPDITRSARGRLRAESIWLPSLLVDPAVTWTQTDDSHLSARVPPCDGSPADGPEGTGDLHLSTGDAGQLLGVQLPRWGNPTGGAFAEQSFGGVMEAEGTWQGLTVPTQVRIGWHPGTAEFAGGGEFFRAKVSDLRFR